MKRWVVIGAGPCGIASVGRLLDEVDIEVTWIDPCFDVGRMGKYYRHVPANTPNHDLCYAFHLCSSFDFDNHQELRRKRSNDRKVLSDLEPNQCDELGYLVDALDDSLQILMKKTRNIAGKAEDLKFISNLNTWSISIRSLNNDDRMVIETDAVILACGCIPCMLEYDHILRHQGWRGIVESLDRFVDPKYVSNLFLQHSDTCMMAEEVWCVAGTSHSAMLVVMNLINAGAKHVVNIYRSEEFRFQHHLDDGSVRYPGIGLKGPVGDWVEAKYHHHPCITRVRYLERVSWFEQLEQSRVNHVIFAIGFERYLPSMQLIPSIETPFPHTEIDDHLVTGCDFDAYDIHTGEISSIGKLFGVGIAFPPHHVYADGTTEPWVGFKRAIQQTVKMVDRFRELNEQKQ